MINNKFKNILVDFDMIGDTDLAICKYIIFNYNKSYYLKEDVLKSSEYYLKYLLLTRNNINPLTVIFKESYKVDDLYNEILNTKWENVLKFSYNTDLYKAFYSNSVYDIYINCRNMDEVNTVSNQTKDKFKSVINCKDCSPYFSIYYKNSIDILKMNNVQGKSIYIQDYSLNYENYKKGILNSASVALTGNNELKTISIYSDITKDFS